MLFREFAEICERLEAISGRLEMINLLAGELPKLDDRELPVFVRFIMGRIFPDWSPLKLGIGPNLLYEAVAYVVGKKKEAVETKVSAEGDVGRAVELLLAGKTQTSFFSEDMTIGDVYAACEEIALSEGKKSQREKLLAVRKLFANVRPLEGRYLARLILGELRIGIGEGNVRDAIAKAFSVEPAEVDHAFQAMNDLGEVARLARQGKDALAAVHIEIFRPVKMMLAQQGSIPDMVAEHGRVAAEYKYDGTRIQFHRKGNEVRVYSRKLEEVTKAIPDIVTKLTAATKRNVILDGEAVAMKEGRPMPFQFVLRRFRRKYDIEAQAEKIELVPYVFDILVLDGETLIDLPLKDRRKRLEEALTAHVAPQEVSDEPAALEKFYNAALDAGHEGVMVKDLESRYQPGVRGKHWVKVKPEVDTLDLAVIGGEWGEGRRAHFFGSFLLACQDRGELLPVGKVATGISDEMLATIYEAMKDLVVSEKGKEVVFEPQVVFEVGYSEIQASPNYESGFALRFPRFIRVRDDKGVDEIETLEALASRYQKQKSPSADGTG
ncbi:MAG TPA: ATP-dependent DNA ligase [Methanomicrobiales archaeon]|jgi:DNA ligase-1|nr:ATP-dependent DNA ligase [Methanomicrobiales archaeon]